MLGRPALWLGLTLAISACAKPEVPSLAVSLRIVPGQRIRGASLFGTDLFGLPTGGVISPDAAPGSTLLALRPADAVAPNFEAGGAVATALSPDGKTLLLLTSGFNRTFDLEGEPVPEASTEWVFVYDVSSGAPRPAQVLSLANTFVGLAFDPRGHRFFASGGPDDNVHEFTDDAGGRWSEQPPPIALGHLTLGLGGLGIDESPFAAGVAVTTSGGMLVVANHENDSVSIVDTHERKLIAEVPLVPGEGRPGGEFPAGIATVGDSRAFVSCQRDREVVEIDLLRHAVVKRIRVGGEPTKLVANRAGTRVFVANANSDTVSVLDVSAARVLSEIPVVPSAVGSAGANLRGSNPNAVELSPDERTLYVTMGGNNAVAVVALSGGDRGEAAGGTSRVSGFIPTGFYPSAVTASRDGGMLYVAYAKSPTGPNPGGPWSYVTRAVDHPYAPGIANQFSLQLTHGGLLAIPTPPPDVLAKLTTQVLRNNRFDGPPPVPPLLLALRGAVRHVIYVIGENRTYDQIFGDLDRADGDPRLVHWGEAVTPNQHALARAFVTLDRFFDSGGVSGDGWQWSTSARTTDVAEKAIPLEYAARGNHSYDWEGTNRNVNVGMRTTAERIAADPLTPPSPDLLPGTADVAAVDGPEEGGQGFLWDAALARHLTVRNYGAFLDDTRYHLPSTASAYLAPVRAPATTRVRVAFPTRVSLADVTDPYYRGFDMNLADYWREQEWAREFDGYVARGDLPALEIVRLPHDHLGSFATALDHVDTPDAQIADHDYALGLMVERLSRSPFWGDTVLVALEDDAQNGADHVDAHRSLAIFAGGHVRRGAVVSTVYTTPSVLHTIELLLGLDPLAQPDAFAPPMDDVLAAELDTRPFTAVVPAVLHSTTLPIPGARPGDGSGAAVPPRGTAAEWARATAGYDFSRADAAPSGLFNRDLYCASVANAACACEPEPVSCTGAVVSSASPLTEK
jgi:YVTN family beta-propeller protein